jgi:hypothetical protein
MFVAGFCAALAVVSFITGHMLWFIFDLLMAAINVMLADT